MKSHGIATVYQLLHVLGLSPKEVIRKWMNMIDTIREIGGLCTILIHSEYKLANPENLGIYQELLSTIASDSNVL
jgi:hypothetical protein